jgi:hypothetical protein
MEGKRQEVKYVIVTINFMALAILFLPSIQSYYLSRNPYDSDVVQIEPPLPAPYIERTNDIHDQEKNIRGYWLQDIVTPAVLQSSSLQVGYDGLTDYTKDYGNLLEDMPANGEPYDGPVADTYAVSSEPLVDLPTGIPESVSNQIVCDKAGLIYIQKSHKRRLPTSTGLQSALTE